MIEFIQAAETAAVAAGAVAEDVTRMGLWELFVIALGLSMDAFAVSICKGLSVKGDIKAIRPLFFCAEKKICQKFFSCCEF